MTGKELRTWRKKIRREVKAELGSGYREDLIVFVGKEEARGDPKGDGKGEAKKKKKSKFGSIKEAVEREKKEREEGKEREKEEGRRRKEKEREEMITEEEKNKVRGVWGCGGVGKELKRM